MDNQGALNLAKNPINFKRTKHIHVKYHYVRNEVQNRNIDLLYVPTSDNVSDIFTKAVSKSRLNQFRLIFG